MASAPPSLPLLQLSYFLAERVGPDTVLTQVAEPMRVEPHRRPRRADGGGGSGPPSPRAAAAPGAAVGGGGAAAPGGPGSTRIVLRLPRHLQKGKVAAAPGAAGARKRGGRWGGEDAAATAEGGGGEGVGPLMLRTVPSGNAPLLPWQEMVPGSDVGLPLDRARVKDQVGRGEGVRAGGVAWTPVQPRERVHAMVAPSVAAEGSCVPLTHPLPPIPQRSAAGSHRPLN